MGEQEPPYWPDDVTVRSPAWGVLGVLDLNFLLAMTRQRKRARLARLAGHFPADKQSGGNKIAMPSSQRH